MNLSFNADTTKEKVFTEVEKYLGTKNFNIDKQDNSRPWGGFFVIDESQAEAFIKEYFSHLKKEDLLIGDKLSPKILVVAPEKRLSWQYHHRRAEIWKLIGGEAAVITSDTDEEKNKRVLKPGDIVQLKQGERHRLIGTNQWGIVAEIWQHTNAQYPSDEDDIVRVQDDFGR
jgi:mannose-6-phosphate isomerase